MSDTFNLPAYFDRIGWRDNTALDLKTLQGLLRAHMASIPFENFDVLLRRPIRLDLDSLQQKLVDARRGGYCFEHATLFAASLETLGFAPCRHSARVVLMTPRQASPRSHMFLTVALTEGRYVVDPGFGAIAPRVPVPLANGSKVEADGVTHWMERQGNYWCLRAMTGDKVVDCWVTTLCDDVDVDFVVGNHYTSTHPASPFVNRIMLRAIVPDGSVSLVNRELTLRSTDGVSHRQVRDRAELRALVAQYWGFDLPEIEQLRVPSIPEWQ